MDWAQFSDVVGKVPASAVDHYPQWWHGDRPNTRGWRAAGFEVDAVRPGRWVRFRRARLAGTTTGSMPATVPLPASPAGTRSNHGAPTPRDRNPAPSPAGPEVLRGVPASGSLVVLPCSARKRPGGTPPVPADRAVWPGTLLAARAHVRDAARVDETLVLPAWQRYTGHLYAEAGPAVSELAAAGRLLILSGGYGLVEGTEPIGDYDQKMSPRDWPPGLLEGLLAERAAAAGLHVVAFAAATSGYLTVLSRARWTQPPGLRVVLVSVDGVRGGAAREVPRRLGQTLAAWWEGSDAYPAGLTAREVR